MIRNKILAGTYTVSPPSVTLLFTDGQRIVNLFGASPAVHALPDRVRFVRVPM